MNKEISKWYEKNIPDTLAGKVIIVTGANSGLGFEASKFFISKGATVAMACRNLNKANEAAWEIRKDFKGADLNPMEVDLADLSSVNSFIKNFKVKFNKLDVLINNAGVMAIPRNLTKDGFEMQLGTNHLGHFALTAGLFDLLNKTEGSRIVNVSSMLHKQGSFDWNDLMWEKSYSRVGAYARSKLANLLFTIKLQQLINFNKKNVKVFAAHPGYSDTNLQSQMVNFENNGFIKGVMKAVTSGMNAILAQSAQMGSLGTILCAVSESVKPGAFYGPEGFGGMRGFPVENKYDPKIVKQADADKLWVESEKLTKTKFNF